VQDNRNKSQWIDIVLHSDTISWFWTNNQTSLLLLLNSVC